MTSMVLQTSNSLVMEIRRFYVKERKLHFYATYNIRGFLNCVTMYLILCAHFPKAQGYIIVHIRACTQNMHFYIT